MSEDSNERSSQICGDERGVDSPVLIQIHKDGRTTQFFNKMEF